MRKALILAVALLAIGGGAASAAPPIFNGTANLYATPGTAPLTITGASAQSADLFDVLLFGGTNVFKIGSTGAISATVGFSAANVTDSALTPGNCVQAGSGGLLTTAAAPCGSGGGGAVSSVNSGASGNLAISPTTGSVVADLSNNIAFAPSGTASSGATRFPSNHIALSNSTWNGSAAVTSSANLFSSANGAGPFTDLLWGGDSFCVCNGTIQPPGTGSTSVIKMVASGSPVIQLFNASGGTASFQSGSIGPGTASGSFAMGDIFDNQFITAGSTGLSINGSGFTGAVKAQGGFIAGNTTTLGTAVVYSGSGVPSFSAPNGSIYLNFSGTPGTNTFYVNTSGASTSGTTWTAKF